MLSNIWSDLRIGARAISGRPTFAVVVMLTLALGIGVNVAIYSLAEEALLRELPVPEPERLVNLVDREPRAFARMDPERIPLALPSDNGGSGTVFSYPMFRDLERDQEPFVGIAAHRMLNLNVATGEQTRSTPGAAVSGEYFSVLGLQSEIGRLLGPEDDQVDGVANSVVLSYSYWQSQFGGEASVLGRTLRVNDVPLTIVGVAPRGFRGSGVIASILPLSVFVPITISFPEAGALAPLPSHDRRDFYWVHLFARLKPGLTRDAAAAAMNPLYRGILSEVEAPLLIETNEQQREAFRTRTLMLEAGNRGQTSSEVLSIIRIGIGVLFAISALVLTLCAANVAGLILLRATTRSGELAMRASMGATRGRLASLLLMESLVLTLPAALLSLPVAMLILRGTSRLPDLPAPLPSILATVSGLNVSAAAAFLAIGVAVASALLAGLLPLRRMIQIEPAKALQTFGARHTTAKGVARFRTALATAQVALSMALLALTAAFADSLASMARIDPGTDLDSIVMSRVMFPDSADVTMRARVEEALGAIPGVSSVSASNEPFLSAWPDNPASAAVDGVEAGRQPVSLHNVSPSFFRTFGMQLRAGRGFSETDIRPGGFFSPTEVPRQVMIVSQRFAERFGLAPDDIIGRTIDYGFIPAEIVGVVSDVRAGGITSQTELPVFAPAFGNSPGFHFFVRSTRPPEDTMNAIRETLTRFDPTARVSNLQTMERQFQEGIAIEHFLAGTASVFAVFATALAALGLYGVLAYSVAQRSREIGLRFALGAQVGRIRGLVLRQVGVMAVVGVVLGSIAAWSLGRVARSLFSGVQASDPLVLGAAAAVVAIVTLGAASVPARRASRVDPMTVLRYE